MEYIIKYNYSEPYKVLINGTHAQVLKAQDHEIYKLILEQDFVQVFIGKSESDGSEYDGNTILIQESEYSYVWIGDRIIRFMAYEQIIEYKSPLGPNEVPYPWAVDSRGWVYLFLEDVVMTNPGDSVKLSRPYEYYWFDGLGNICGFRNPLIKNFQSIQKFFIENETYNLGYNPFPEKEYDRLVQSIGPNLFVEKTDGIKYPLNKQEFCDLMKEFGEVAGFCPLDHIDVLDKLN